MDPIRKHIHTKFSNILMLLLMPGREQKDAVITTIAEMITQIQRRGCQLDCKLGRCISEHTMWPLLERTRSKFGTRSVCEGYW